MKRAVKIYLQFKHDTGHEHPNFRTVFGNYVALLGEMGYTERQVRARLQEIAAECGFSIG